MKSSEESTYTPAILSPRSKDRKALSLSANLPIEKNKLKPSYQMWMDLVQRLGTRISSGEDRPPVRERKSWTYSAKLNSNKQVVSLMNHYSSILTADTNDQLTPRYNDRPKSILRSRGTIRTPRFTKEVKFAID